jgi:uncharacterized protein
MMNIQHKSGNTKGSFYIEKEKEIKAGLTYSKAGTSQIIIDHTEVSDEFRGQDVGRKLVEHAVDYARKNNLKVIPLCPFTKSIIERDESLQDVLKK